MKRIFCAGVVAGLAIAASAKEPQLAQKNFVYEVIHKGSGMTALDFDSTGRMYVAEKIGRVLVFEPDGHGGFREPTVFADVTGDVDPEGESGLLGLCLDLNFAANRRLYIFYSAPKEQRLVCLIAQPDGLRMKSQQVLLAGFPRTATNHKAGDIKIHPKDPRALYLTLGDDTEREKVTDLDFYNGKLLRLDPMTGKGLPDNPFYDGKPDSIRSRVWARGFRNPFRFAFHPDFPKTSVIYVSENGDRTDRIARIPRGSSGGWGKDGDKGLEHPDDPNVTVLETSLPCLTGIAIASSGPFAGEDGVVLFYDQWFSQELKIRKLSGGALDKFEKVSSGDDSFARDFSSVNLKFGPDGALYTTQSYYSAVGNDHELGRIRFTGTR